MRTIYFLIVNIIDMTISSQIYENPESNFRCDFVEVNNEATCTVFFDMEDNTDTSLKSCVMKASNADQSILVLQGHKIPQLKPNITFKYPNIVIFIESLSAIFFENPFLPNILKSSQSLLYIVVTAKDSLYKCEDGALSKEGQAAVENFVNHFWHGYQILRFVMIFPFTCPHNFAVYDGKKPSTTPLYDRTIKLIGDKQEQLSDAIKLNTRKITEDYPLKANLFYRFPTSITGCDSLYQYVPVNRNITGDYCGLDALIMQDLVSHFKFNISFPKLDYCNSYGYASEHRLPSGSLGCIVRNDIDVSFNSRFLQPSSYGEFHYLYYVKQDSLCVLMLRPDAIPLWHYPINIYDTEFWILIFFSFLAIGLCMWTIGKIRNKMANEKFFNLHYSLLNAFSSTIFGFSLNRKPRFSILQTTCFCISFVLSALYQSNINYLFTTTTRYNRLSTLRDLCNTDAVMLTSPSIIQLLQPIERYVHSCRARFKGVVHAKPNSEDFINLRGTRLKHLKRLAFMLESRNTGIVTRRSDIIMEVQLFYTDPNDRPMLYVVDECFKTYYLSMIASEKFPFVHDMKIAMQRLIEAGLPNKYYIWTRRAFGITEKMLKFGPEPRPYSKVTMGDSRIPFGFLLSGYFASALTLLVEIRWHQRHK